MFAMDDYLVNQKCVASKLMS